MASSQCPSSASLQHRVSQQVNPVFYNANIEIKEFNRGGTLNMLGIFPFIPKDQQFQLC